MPKYHVEKNQLIDAPVDSVHALTRDFNQWPTWSPWLCMEPEATVSVHGTPGEVDHGYSWTGTLVGEGKMQTTAHENGVHKMDLTFIKPFKSTAKVTLDIKQVGADQTSVTWHMWSALPFFLFFMTRSIKNMIGMDYERGLKMLKECAETGSVNSITEVKGVVEINDIHYAGQSASCQMDNIADSMDTTMRQVVGAVNDKGLQISDIPAGAIYDHMDFNNRECRYTAIIPLQSRATTDNSLSTGTIASGKALKVVHKGSYTHLGNGWATAMSYQRYHKLKPLRSQPPFELYLNNPEHTDAKDLITEIYIPLRG